MNDLALALYVLACIGALLLHLVCSILASCVLACSQARCGYVLSMERDLLRSGVPCVPVSEESPSIVHAGILMLLHSRLHLYLHMESSVGACSQSRTCNSSITESVLPDSSTNLGNQSEFEPCNNVEVFVFFSSKESLRFFLPHLCRSLPPHPEHDAAEHYNKPCPRVIVTNVSIRGVLLFSIQIVGTSTNGNSPFPASLMFPPPVGMQHILTRSQSGTATGSHSNIATG